ncbi:hypothetical protein BLNAU_11144 [Blattamonas nauphoetae]|uniref:Uncharacterized protein n=1 Tax=Blattamonas nauphoetae TaxID=2049346 RepID=A0ABQ9XQ73_9EUKA|nr:hypothetical protein BLNAU_11144 [Blattamonas nauphoetae]
MTTLASTSLLNTTSSCGRESVDLKERGSDFGHSESVSQKMIGSCVSCCTNHLYGTGIRDVNLGGSVLCSNTSFTHCTTTTEHFNEHRTIRTEITTADTLHLFSLCTFKGCPGANGSALYLYRISADLEIASCSFESCQSSGAGGAIYYQQSSVQSSVVISSSSFVKCSSNSLSGGSLELQQMQSLTISDCMFLESRTTWYGGVIYVFKCAAGVSNPVLSNCLFDDCSATLAPVGRGGALYCQNCPSIRLDSLRFRECVAGKGEGHDLFFSSPLPTLSLSTVSNCDSTSTPKENRIYPTSIAEDDVLPTPTHSTTILSLINEPDTSTTAEIVVTLDKTVTGSLLVLVSNSEGTARTDTTKAPNIGRVLLFTIDETNIGRCSVSTGETSLLQLPLEEYKVVTSSFSGIFFLHPTFTSAECVLDDSCTRALLNLEGFDVDGESFELTLQNGSAFNATFSDNKATIDLGVIGEGSKWMENQVFVITSGKKTDDDSIIVSIPSPLYFTIPEAARLCDIVVSVLNPAKTEVTLSFSSRLLKPEHDYTITLEWKEGNGRVVMDVTTNSDGLIAEQTVTLHPSNGNEEELKNSIGFGDEFKVTDFSAKTGDERVSIQFSPIFVTMPIEPVRITLASCTTNETDWTVVSVEGSGFVLGEFYTVSVSGHPIGSLSPPPSSLHDTSFVVIASSSNNAISSALQLHPVEGSDLKFSYSYTIVGITNGTEPGVVDTVVFETQDDIPRNEALITRIEVVPASSLNTTIVIEVSGSNLPTGTSGQLTLVDSFFFAVSFSSSSFGRSTVIALGLSGSLGFGSDYEIKTLEDSIKQTIPIPETRITTPPKPSKLSLCVCGNEERAGMDMNGADPESCSAIKSAWNTATSLGILDTTMRVVDSADLSSPLIVTHRVPFTLISFQAEPATLRASPSSSQQSSTLVSVEEGGLCRLTLLSITADLSVSTFKLVSVSKGTVVIRSCSIEGTRQSEMNSEDGSICGWSRGLIELIETDTELNGVTMKEIVVGGIWMQGGKLTITKSEFSQNGPSIADFPSARQVFPPLTP